MKPIELVHTGYVAGRRVRVLAGHLARIVPANAEVLDIGAGDGKLLAELERQRPDLSLSGIDVLVRAHSHAAIEAFDGRTIPREDSSVDVTLLVDVLHHSCDAIALLREARRVSRRWILVKDHALEGLGAEVTLRFMDRVGNLRHGVAVPGHYWRAERWQATWEGLGLVVESWQTRLGLYPWPANFLFERSLHFLALLRKA